MERFRRDWGGNHHNRNYKVGTLVVDLFDAKTKQLIWRGNSSDTLSNNSNKNIQNLDKDVEKMFKKFPPGFFRRSRRG